MRQRKSISSFGGIRLHARESQKLKDVLSREIGDPNFFFVSTISLSKLMACLSLKMMQKIASTLESLGNGRLRIGIFHQIEADVRFFL